VVDLELPTESGYELCELIRETPDFAKIPILVTSDSSDPEHMAFAERAGANAFLRKPFSMKELARYIDALVRNTKRSEPQLHRLRP
jgi:DNA-binding response OmpR family regulator